jgi:hypothetical protein
MLNYIKQYISGIKLRYHTDNFGNIYVTKQTDGSNFIGMVAHTDTVHPIVEELNIFQYKNILYGYGLEKGQYGPLGCGGDDKVGVYMCMQALKDLPNIKCVFYRQEEIGCVGSNASDINYLQDCSFVIQCDRKNNNDFITRTNGVDISSREFIDDCKPLMEQYGYKEAIGTSTDVGTIKIKGLKTSCVNLSCGFYRPHMDATYVDINDVQKCYNLIVDMCTKLRQKHYTHEYTPVTYQPAACDEVWTYGYGGYDCRKPIAVTKRVISVWNVVDIESGYTFFRPIKIDWLIMGDGNMKFPVSPTMDKILYGDNITMTPEEREAYLTAFNKGYKMRMLEGNNTNTVVFSRFHNAWIATEMAIWCKDLNTYILQHI